MRRFPMYVQIDKPHVARNEAGAHPRLLCVGHCVARLTGILWRLKEGVGNDSLGFVWDLGDGGGPYASYLAGYDENKKTI